MCSDSISVRKISWFAGKRSMAEIARKPKLPGVRVSQLTVFKDLTGRLAKERYKKDVTHYYDYRQGNTYTWRKAVRVRSNTTIGTIYFKSLNSISLARVIWLLSASLFSSSSGDHLDEASRLYSSQFR